MLKVCLIVIDFNFPETAFGMLFTTAELVLWVDF